MEGRFEVRKLAEQNFAMIKGKVTAVRPDDGANGNIMAGDFDRARRTGGGDVVLGGLLTVKPVSCLKGFSLVSPFFGGPGRPLCELEPGGLHHRVSTSKISGCFVRLPDAVEQAFHAIEVGA